MATEAQDRDARKDDEKIAHPVVPVETEDAPRGEDQQQRGRLASLNLIVNSVGVVAVALGVWLAKETVDVAFDQLTVNRDAGRLEQRPWLRYAGFTLQSHNNTSGETWQDREISDSGDVARFRVSVVNSGRTPALNVTLSTAYDKLASPSYIDKRPTESTEWRPVTEPQGGVVVMPGEQGHSLYTPRLLLHSQHIKGYMKGDLRILVWTKLQYCDIYQRRHWALIAVARQVGSRPDSHFTLVDQLFGPADGEPGHSYCQNIVEDAG